MGSPFSDKNPQDGTPRRPATYSEIEQYQIAEKYIDIYPFSRAFSKSISKQRLFFYTFDGTGNDRDAMVIDTNPAELERLIPSSQNPRIHAGYKKGVGTGRGFDPAVGGATGEGSKDIVRRAYLEFSDQTNAWLREEPNAEIIVVATGFSRGSANARDFANMVHERGIPDYATEKVNTYFDDEALEFVADVSYSRNLVEPGKVRIGALMLYDSVSTNQRQVLKQSIPPSVESVLHLVSSHERRISFPVDSIQDASGRFDPRLVEIILPGVHSDIGGSYDRGLGAYNLLLGHKYLRKTIGNAIADLPAELQPGDNPMFVHDSDWLLTDILHALGFNQGGKVRGMNYFSNPEVPPARLKALYPSMYETQPPAPDLEAPLSAEQLPGFLGQLFSKDNNLITDQAPEFELGDILDGSFFDRSKDYDDDSSLSPFEAGDPNINTGDGPPKPLGTDAASQPEDTQTDLEHLAALRAFEDNQNAPDTLQALEDFTGKDFDDLDATFGIEGLTWADGDLEDPFAEYDEDSPDYQPPTPGEIDLLGNINQLIDSSDLLNGQVLSDIGGLITDSGITDLDIIDDIGRLASQGGENLFGVLGEIRELAFNNPLGDIDVLNDVTNLIDTVGITGDAVLGGVNRLVQRSGLTDTVAVRRVGQLLNQRGVVQVAAQAAGQFAEVPLSFARDLGNIEVIDDIEAFSKVKDRTQSFLTQQTPNGWVLMMLGKYMFSLSNAAYQQMTRSIEYRWPAEARIGRRPALQFVGTGQETISLSGSIYPSYAGGLRQIDAMRELAGSGEPLILMDGLGYNHHEWCIVRIKETSRMVLENSAPRRVDFELELSRYGRDNGVQAAASGGGGAGVSL